MKHVPHAYVRVTSSLPSSLICSCFCSATAATGRYIMGILLPEGHAVGEGSSPRGKEFFQSCVTPVMSNCRIPVFGCKLKNYKNFPFYPEKHWISDDVFEQTPTKPVMRKGTPQRGQQQRELHGFAPRQTPLPGALRLDPPRSGNSCQEADHNSLGKYIQMATSTFLFLVAMSGAPSSVLARCSKARSP